MAVYFWYNLQCRKINTLYCIITEDKGLLGKYFLNFDIKLLYPKIKPIVNFIFKLNNVFFHPVHGYFIIFNITGCILLKSAIVSITSLYIMSKCHKYNTKGNS